MPKEIKLSLNKVGPIELILIPHRILIKCIVNAKSNASKQRLVFAATQSMCEQMKRLHVRGYVYPRDDKKHNYKEKSTSEYIWEGIKGYFNGNKIKKSESKD
jgi:hypothetical protein